MPLFHNYNKAATPYGEATPLPPCPATRQRYDSLVVGGGLAGLHTALELAERGQKVLLCERGTVGQEASSRSGGQLWAGFDQSFSDMCHTLGAETAQAAWRMVDRGAERVQQRLDHHPTRCDFQAGVALASLNEGDKTWLKAEAACLAQAGLNFAQFIDTPTLREQLLNSTVFTAALLYEGSEERPRYGHVNPRLYVDTMAALALKAGVHILEHTPVQQITTNLRNMLYRVTTPRQHFLADSVVLATGVAAQPLHPYSPARHFIPAQTLMFATEPLPAPQARAMIAGSACFADTRDMAMGYGRLIPAEDGSNALRLTYGGADAMMQMRPAMAFAAQRVRRNMDKTFPHLRQQGVTLTHRWGGLCDLSRDGLPRIAEPSPRLYHLTGFSGQGNVLSAVLGTAVAEKITRRGADDFKLIQRLTASTPPLPHPLLAAQLRFMADRFLG